HIPAKDRSKISVMQEVYADIGDEQSIEQSLSTFSSHMTNIVSILDSQNDGCLILLDELGAGTDPVEGAALAVSILEKLMDTNALVMATTHYSELKGYALSEEGVQNASMEFDVKKLAPTYHMQIGMPGRSNAFEISKRLGLKEDVIERAEVHISTDAKKLEDVIYKADIHRKKAHSERVKAEQIRKDTQTYEKRAKQKSESTERQQKKIIDDAKKEAQKIIDKAKRESDEIIRVLKESKSGSVDRDIQNARDAMRDIQKSVDVKGVTIKNNEIPKGLIKGEGVILIDSNTPATVISEPNKKGDVQVQAGVMKLKTNIANLKRSEQKPIQVPVKSKGNGLSMERISMEIDIRGRNSEEGIMEVDMYLDRAYSSHLSKISIIHGKGTGVLREQIHRHLKKHPIVKNYRLGKYGEGESGVTIVELK
ncbi:MAG: Smr/MutS family protein, partial [Clostridiales bacterium]|nr:Smr/MutS family protein [Clostridiales bacterium]